MSAVGGKYVEADSCDWCGSTPARSYVMQKNGTKEKRYTVAAVACHPCAVRMELVDDATGKGRA